MVMSQVSLYSCHCCCCLCCCCHHPHCCCHHPSHCYFCPDHRHVCDNQELLGKLNCYCVIWEAFEYFKLTTKILLYQMNLCVLTCIIINFVVDTDLAACDTYRSIQNAQVGLLCAGRGYNTINLENRNLIIQVYIAATYENFY